MKRFIKAAAIFSAAVMIAVPLMGCDSEADTESQISSKVESAVIEKLDSATLKAEIIGEWGRLDEVMHYFYSDMTCIIGGMRGTYDIDENSSLVLTTMSGSVTTYEWASSKSEVSSENYWYMADGTITINGNNFTKIVEETEDTAE